MKYEECFTPEIIDSLAKDGINVPSKEAMTCAQCVCADDCPYAWDLYNTEGDCLADK